MANPRCELHGMAMSLMDSDRSGQTWSCALCAKGTAIEIRRETVIAEFQKAYDASPLGGDVTLPRFLVKWALRSLDAQQCNKGTPSLN